MVKINPANLGVGLYQHVMKAKHLKDSLDAVVESCVNFVGVDVNAASPALLRYVSGMNALTARRVYEYRREHGPFKNREQLKSVPGFGEATFVQAAGFLKIIGGENPLDATWIHPESYATARRVLEKMGSLYKILQETFQGLRVVKAFTMEPYERRRFHDASREYAERSIKVTRIDALTSPRRYRPEMSAEKAFAILDEETARGWWDRDIVETLKSLKAVTV